MSKKPVKEKKDQAGQKPKQTLKRSIW